MKNDDFQAFYRKLFGLPADYDLFKHLQETHWQSRANANCLLQAIKAVGLTQEAIALLQQFDTDVANRLLTKAKNELPNHF
jgi:hypothetical protein